MNLICLILGHKIKSSIDAVGYDNKSEELCFEKTTYCERCDKILKTELSTREEYNKEKNKTFINKQCLNKTKECDSE